MTAKRPLFFILAESGSEDILGADLTLVLHDKFPQALGYGVCGAALRRAGVQELLSIEAFSSFISDKAPYERREFETNLIETIDRLQPAVAILVGYSTFQRRIGEALSLRGIPVVLYGAPNIRALAPHEIQVLKNSVDNILGGFPGEGKDFEELGLSYSFVGSSLKNRSAKVNVSPEALGFTAEEAIVALLPGSRSFEFLEIAQFMIRVQQILRPSNQSVRFVMPVSEHIPIPYVAKAFGVDSEQISVALHDWSTGVSPRIDLDGVTVVRGMSLEILSVAKVALSSQGSSSIEAALFGIPQLAITISQQRFSAVGANQMARANIVKEFPTSDNALVVAQALMDLLHDPEQCATMSEAFMNLRNDVKGLAAENAAAIIGQYLGPRAMSRRHAV